MSSFSRAGIGILKNSLIGKVKIGEMTIAQGKFSNFFLEMIPSNAELFRTDYPIQNYKEFLPKDFHFATYLTPGSIFTQLYPSNTMEMIYAFQVFNNLSTLIYAPDHLFSTLSKIPKIRQILSKQQDLDLSYLLDLRYKELKTGGELIFDILTPPEQSPEDPKEHYSWDCLDLSVQLSKDLFPKPQQSRLNLHPCFRTKGEVMNILKRFNNKYAISELEEHIIYMPAYKEYLEKDNIELYIQELVDF